MDIDEFLEGHSLTGRQAAIIFFGFLLLVIIAGLALLLFSDLIQELIA